MDILSKLNLSNVYQSPPVSTIVQAALGTIRWTIELFTLTEEDRMAAGICLDDEEYDR
jgi:hypothetical protein